MISVYGAQAGNVALTLMATGGVYLGGGIAPKILPRLRPAASCGRSWTRGASPPCWSGSPCSVILNELTALLGAARVAAGGAS